MTGFCVVLAEELSRDSRYVHEIDSEFITNLRRAAPLHDIGKVAIPDHILLKPGKLSPEEWKIMRTHAAIGAATIRSARVRSSDSSFLLMAEEIADGHHEWFDGNGYPRGIYGIGPAGTGETKLTKHSLPLNCPQIAVRDSKNPWEIETSTKSPNSLTSHDLSPKWGCLQSLQNRGKSNPARTG